MPPTRWMRLPTVRRRGKRVIVAGGTGFYLRALTGGVDARAAIRRGAARAPRARGGAASARVSARLARTARSRARARAWLRTIRIACCARSRSRSRRRRPTLRDAPLRNAGERRNTVDAGLPRRTVERDRRANRAARAADARGGPGGRSGARRRGGRRRQRGRLSAGAAHICAGGAREDELRASLERATRRYARRQRAWFRSEPDDALDRARTVAERAREKLGWSTKRDDDPHVTKMHGARNDFVIVDARTAARRTT